MGERAPKVGIYPRLMLTYVVSAFFAIAITSFVMTMYMRQSVVRTLSSSVQASIERTSMVLDVMADSVKTFALQLYFDRDISKLRNLESPDVFEISTATYRLSTFGAVLPYVESIYIYSDIAGRYYVTLPYGPTRVYPASRFYDRDVASILHNTHQYSVLFPISREIPLENSAGDIARTKGLTFVFFGPSDQNTATEGAVVLNMSQTWVQQLIADEGDSIGGATVIANESGGIAVEDAGNVMGQQLSRTNIVSRILREDHPYGHMVARIGDRRFLVAYAEYAPFKWVLIRAIPLGRITSQVNAAVLKAVLICLAILLLGLLTSMIASQRALIPVKTLISRVYEMQGEIRITREARKIEYLKKLIALSEGAGDGPVSIDGLDLKISVGVDRIFVLLYVIVDKFDRLSARYNARERDRLKARIIEITTSAVGDRFAADGVAMDDERIVVFVDAGPAGDARPPQDFAGMLARAQSALLADLDVSVSFVVSRCGTGIGSIPALYEQVRSAAPNRFFHGPAAVFSCDDPAEAARKDFSDFEYPVKREKAFVRLLVSGDFERAQAVLDEIFSECLAYSFGTFRLVLARVVSVTNSSLAEIERLHNIAISRNLDRLILELDKLESYSEVRDYFARYFESLASEMSTTTEEKHRRLLKRIEEIISSEYANRNLSLQLVADRVGMSPPYLSRLYHRFRGRSIVSEINDVRIRKAKRMLKDADTPIDRIVHATGFSNSQHFFRVFRQRAGMTPREFRDAKLWKPPGAASGDAGAVSNPSGRSPIA